MHILYHHKFGHYTDGKLEHINLNYTLVHGKSLILSVSHLLDTLTTWWLDCDSVVTIDNCQKHSYYTAIGSLVTMLPATIKIDYTVTVQSLCLVSDWWNGSFALYYYNYSDNDTAFFSIIRLSMSIYFTVALKSGTSYQVCHSCQSLSKCTLFCVTQCNKLQVTIQVCY